MFAGELGYPFDKMITTLELAKSGPKFEVGSNFFNVVFDCNFDTNMMNDKHNYI